MKAKQYLLDFDSHYWRTWVLKVYIMITAGILNMSYDQVSLKLAMNTWSSHHPNCFIGRLKMTHRLQQWESVAVPWKNPTVCSSIIKDNILLVPHKLSLIFCSCF